MRNLFPFPLVVAMMLGLPLVACVNPLDLTPQQVANLDKFVAAGQIIVRTTTNLYCVVEPTTTEIIRVFDPSKGTANGTGKFDAATAILCKAALASGATVTP